MSYISHIMMVAGWKTVNVKEGLMSEVESIIKTSRMNASGITNSSQFVDAAIKEKLEKEARRRFEHVNMYEDHVKILDNKLDRAGRIVSVYFKDNKAWCEYCDENFCVHIQYAWTLDDVRAVLKERGMIEPSTARL